MGFQDPPPVQVFVSIDRYRTFIYKIKKYMKEQILKLRNEGKTYSEIKKILGCPKSTISYYCGNEQKEKTKNRIRKRRSNILI